MRAAVPALWLLLVGCAPAPLEFRVVRASPEARDDPYASASRVVLALEEDGVLLPDTVEELPVDAARLELSSLPFGVDLRIRVETHAQIAGDDVVLARGRSFPFDYPAGGPPPSARPDVTLGLLGTFGRTTETGPESAPRAVLAIADGAVLVTDAGRLWRYVAHDASDGRARLLLLANATLGPGAAWVALEGRGFLGLLDDRAELWGADGARVAQVTDARLRAHGARPTLVALEDGALAVGGASDAPSRALTRLRVHESGALFIEPLTPLDEGLAGAGAVALKARGQGTELEERVLVHGGRTPTGPVNRLLLLDPGAPVPVVDSLDDPAVAPAEAASAALSAGLVALAGGAHASGPTDAVVLVQVRATSIEGVTPLRFGLSSPRRGSTMVVVGAGADVLALVAGGAGPLGAPSRDADLLEVQLGPADVFPTGGLPIPSAAPASVLLSDGTALVVGEGLTAVYFSPRDPG